MPFTGFSTAPRKFNSATNSFTAKPIRSGLAPAPSSQGPATGTKQPANLPVPTRKSKRLLTPFDTGYSKQRPFVKAPQITEAGY